MWDWAPKRISGLPRCASQRARIVGLLPKVQRPPILPPNPARFHPRSCALTLRLTVIAQQKQPPPGSSVSRRRRMCAHWITRRVLPALRCALLLRAQLSRTRPAAGQQTAKDEYRGLACEALSKTAFFGGLASLGTDLGQAGLQPLWEGRPVGSAARAARKSKLLLRSHPCDDEGAVASVRLDAGPPASLAMARVLL